MSTYGWVLLCTIAGPFALSFDKKIHFYTRFRPLFIAILPVSTFFLLWDAYFTDNHIWGFTDEHIAKIYLYNLPVEEVLFFFLVPYSCVFIYEVLIGYFPKLNLFVFSTYFSYLFIALGTTKRRLLRQTSDEIPVAAELFCGAESPTVEREVLKFTVRNNNRPQHDAPFNPGQ